MMPPRKTKAPQVLADRGLSNSSNSKGIFNYLGDAIKAGHKQASIAAWRMAYALEEARQTHAALGHLWREAGCCVALSLIQIFGGCTQ